MAARRYGRAEGPPEERAPRWGRGLAPALIVPAVLAGATSAVLVHTTQSPERSGAVEERSPRQAPRDLGATGQLPQQQRPAQQVLDHAGDPRALATGAGPPVPVPSGPQGIPQPALTAYLAAADRLSDSRPGCGLDWSVIAAIGRIESDHARSGRVDSGGTTTRAVLGPPLDGRGVAAVPDSDRGALDGDPVWDRAVGPMQLLPSTWEQHGGSASGTGPGSPHNLADAALATGKILCASGGNLRSPPDLAAAVFSYNHSDQYVRTVLVWADAYARGATPTPVEQASASRDPLAGERVTAPPLQLEPSAGELGWPVPVQPGPGVPPAGPPEWAVPVEPGTPRPAPSADVQPPNAQPPAQLRPPEPGPSEPFEPVPPSAPARPSAPGTGGPSEPAQPARPSEPFDPDMPSEPGRASAPGTGGTAEPGPAELDLAEPGRPGGPAVPSEPAAPGRSGVPGTAPPAPPVESPRSPAFPGAGPQLPSSPTTAPQPSTAPQTRTGLQPPTGPAAPPSATDLGARPCGHSAVPQGSLRAPDTSSEPGNPFRPEGSDIADVLPGERAQPPNPCVAPHLELPPR